MNAFVAVMAEMCSGRAKKLLVIAVLLIGLPTATGVFGQGFVDFDKLSAVRRISSVAPQPVW